MHDDNHGIGRRPVLKTAGMTLAGLGGLASPVAAGKGKRPLEEEPSFLEFSIIAGADMDGDGKINDLEDFSFMVPVIAGASDTPGLGDTVAFDTTVPQVTPGDQAIHYVLRFVQGAILVNKPKPYVLNHTGGGRYRSQGATVNFEVGDVGEVPPLFQQLIRMIGGPGKYRAVAHDEVQLTEKGGHFDWSATRAGFYRRGNGGIDHKISLLYLVWDEDNGDRGDPGVPLQAPASPPPDVVPTAMELITNGKLNPGGR